VTTARRAARTGVLVVLVVVATLGLIGCGGDDTERSTGRSPDRQAFYQVRGTFLCVGDQADAGALRLQYESSRDANGNGPFPLSGNWCGSNPNGIAGTVTNPDGTVVFRIFATNPEIGAPGVVLTCRHGSKSDPDYRQEQKRFSVDETHTFRCNPYTVEVERQSDTDVQKRFQAWVRRA